MTESDRFAQQVTAQIRHLLSTCPRCAERDAQDADNALMNAAMLAAMTARRRQVLQCLADGLTQREICRALVISEGTAKKHVMQILQILGAPNAAAAVAIGLRRGLIT